MLSRNRSIDYNDKMLSVTAVVGSYRPTRRSHQRQPRHQSDDGSHATASSGEFQWKSNFTRGYRNGILMALLALTSLHQPQLTSSEALKAVSAAALANQSATSSPTEHCTIFFGNKKVLKEVGAVWVSSNNPCAVYVCESDSTGVAKVVETEETCHDFYCDVDSELRPQEGTCCGACVRTKCRYNDNVYSIGQIWHNKDDCTLLECQALSNGLPIINAYQKNCPPLPRDCAPAEIYVQDCCQYCKRSRNSGLGDEEDEDIWTEEYYRNHPCVRECRANEPPRTCRYTFVVEWYETLSKACYDCPQNLTDCSRPHCVLGDGIPRSITVVNRMMPGPAIEVCQNDIIIVDVRNELLGESTTMHWHGLHQLETPYMDGVPHITQCPISPHSTFRYTFKADNPGTHFWHSHTGMQRGDGVFGALIIRRPRPADPNGHLYDFDLSQHSMIVQDWVHVPGISMFASHHHSRGDNKPRNLLINGRGRFYDAIWEMIKNQGKETRGNGAAATTEAETTTNNTPLQTEMVPATPATEAATEGSKELKNTPQTSDDEIDFLHSLDNSERIRVRAKGNNEILRLARLARTEVPTISTSTTTMKPAEPIIPITESTASSKSSSSQLVRSKRSTNNYTVALDQMPLQVYNVQRGFRYRFRIINAEFLNCPIVVSIDNHTMTAINSDGYDFTPVEVGSIVTYAGERFDFILHAYQPVDNYWIRLKGLMDCSELFTSAFQVAILHYEGASNNEPNGQLGYQHKAPGIELNAMNQGSGHTDALTIAELTGLPSYDSVPGVDRDALKPVPDYKFFVYYDFYPKDNPTFHKGDYYGFNANLSSGNQNRLYTPQLNHISLKFPTVSLLSARDQVDDSMFCNETSLANQGIDCRKEFCKCHHVLQVPLNSVIELIIVDEGFTYDANHPFHLHGNAFRVVGLERLGTNVTIEMVKQLDRYNLLKRNLVNPPVKDTVTVPDGGYTILRFKAYNPGFWLFHCHIEFHAEIGMALVLKVGENDEMMPVPKGFPTCHDYMPNSWGETTEETTGGSTTFATTTSATQSSDNSATSFGLSSGLLIGLMMLLVLNKLKWSQV